MESQAPRYVKWLHGYVRWERIPKTFQDRADCWLAIILGLLVIAFAVHLP
jgi:hypothetical protein